MKSTVAMRRTGLTGACHVACSVMWRLVVLLMLVVAACGGNDQRVAELEDQVAELRAQQSTTTTTAATTTTAEAAPVDMLELWLSEGWNNVDPDQLFELKTAALFDGVDIDIRSEDIQVAAGGADHVDVRLSGGGLLNLEDLEGPLSAFGFPSGTFARLSSSRAVDGVQVASSVGGEYVASWSFDPDAGLSMVIERN